MALDKNTVKLNVVEATKSVVDKLLSINLNNRALCKDQVKKLRRNIANGQWVYNLEVVEVLTDKNGQWACLVNGQHRLTAIKEEGYPKGILLNVVSGYDPDGVYELSLGTDVGRARKGQDVLKTVGAKNASQISTAINTYVRNILRITNYSPAEAAQFYKEHEDLDGAGWDWIVARFNDSIRPGAGFYGAVLADILDGHRDAVQMYLSALSDKGWTNENSTDNPLYLLRRAIDQTIKSRGPKSTGINDCLFAFARKCFDFARNGKKLKSSLVPTGFNGILSRGAVTQADINKYTARKGWDPSAVSDLYPVRRKDSVND